MIFKTACLLCLAVVLVFIGSFSDVFVTAAGPDIDLGTLSVYISEVSFRQESDDGWTDARVTKVKTSRGTETDVDLGNLVLKPDEKAYFRIRIQCSSSSIDSYVRAYIYNYAREYDMSSGTIGVGDKTQAIRPPVLSLSDVRAVYDDGSSFPMQIMMSSMTEERTGMLFNRYVESGHYFDLYFDVDPSGSEWIPGMSAMGIDFTMDAIQTHNAESGILSAWGMNVKYGDADTIWLADDSDAYPVARYWTCNDLMRVHFPVDVPCMFVMNKQVRMVALL